MNEVMGGVVSAGNSSRARNFDLIFTKMTIVIFVKIVSCGTALCCAILFHDTEGRVNVCWKRD